MTRRTDRCASAAGSVDHGQADRFGVTRAPRVHKGRNSWLSLAISLALVAVVGTGCSHIQVDGIALNEWVNRSYFQEVIARKFDGGYPVFDDLDGDGRDELMQIVNSRDTTGLSMFIVSELGAVTRAWGGYNDYGHMSYAGKIDYDRNRRMEAAVTIDRFREKILLLLHSFTAGDTIRGWYLADQDTIFPGHPDRVYLHHAHVFPEDVFGFPALLGALTTTFCDVPRRVFLMDLSHDRFVFNFALGPMPTGFCVADFDRDGEQEILVGTWAPGNGAAANGLRDSEAWLILLDARGNVKYAQHLGDYQCFVHVSPTAFYVGEEPAVFVVRSRNGGRQQTPDFIGLWTWSKRNDFPHVDFHDGILATTSPVFAHDPRNNAQLVYVIRASGQLAVVDQNLRLVRSRRLSFTRSPSSVHLVLADNLTGDESPEVVLHDGKRVYVLDSGLRLIWHKPARTVKGPVRLGGVHKGFWYVGDDDYWHIGTLRLHWGGVALLYGGPVFAFLLVVGAVAGVSQYRKRTRQWRSWQDSALRAWVLESADVGLIVFNAAGRLHSINRKAREILRLPDRIPETLNGLRKELADTPFGTAFDLLWQLENSEEITAQQEVDVPTSDGRRRFLATAEKILAPNGRLVGLAVSFKDITEVLHSRDILAWSSLARRLAHEIKNPLATLLLATERLGGLLDSLSEDARQKARNYLDHLFREIERLRNMASMIMQLTELDTSETELVDVNSLVREAVNQLQSEVPEGVEVDLQLADSLPKVRARRGALLLAIANVVRNAIQAIEGEGRVKIVTNLARGLRLTKAGPDRSYVVVEVSDTGTGIPEDAQERIFEPYFSLRKDGTGLGLAIVKKTIRDLGGHVEFQSQVGVGTTFWLYLPVEAKAGEKD